MIQNAQLRELFAVAEWNDTQLEVRAIWADLNTASQKALDGCCVTGYNSWFVIDVQQRQVLFVYRIERKRGFPEVTCRLFRAEDELLGRADPKTLVQEALGRGRELQEEDAP